MRAAVVVLMALAAPAFGSLFDTWKVHNGKTYSSPEEESLRKAIFDANVEKVNAHNMLGLPWTMGLNEFADLTSQEFAIGRIGGFRPRSLRRPRTVDNTPVGAPSEVDWTTKGAVTAVKNQGQCGSCWAFSTTGSTEGAHFLAGNSLVSLSEQQLVDCSGAEGNQGCNGGLMDDAFQYIINNGGIGSEASYPYTAQDGSCKKVASVAKISSYTDVGQNSESALMNAVAKTPVSVAVEADQSAWQLYSGGIVQASNCGTQLDHGVLAVGYKSGSYWKVKNSWGASWGESGYIRLQMNGDGSGTCGIQMEPSYPVV